MKKEKEKKTETARENVPATAEELLLKRRKKIIGLITLAIILAMCAVMTFVVCKPLFDVKGDDALRSFGERFRNLVAEYGFRAKAVFVVMIVFQVVFALIPGEPFEFAAGAAFGWLEGLLLCMIGILIGSIIIFALVRKFGKPFVNLFFPDKDLDSLKFLQNGERVGVIAFLIMFIPGTPKDLLSYAAGLTKMKWWNWLLIVGIARIPSVVTSTIPGAAVGENNLLLAVIVYGATLLLSLAGLFVYKRITKKRNAVEPANAEPAAEETAE